MNILFVILLSGLFLFSALEFQMKKRNNFIAILVVVTVAFMIGTRNINLVPDSIAYIDFLKYTQDNYFEIGFRYYTRLFKMIFGANTTLYLISFPIINAIVVNCATQKVLRSKGYKLMPAIIMSLYFSFFGILYSGVVLREGIAISFLLLMYGYISEKKFVKAMVCLGIAVSFHRFALIGLIAIIIILFKIQLKQKTYTIINILLGGMFLLSLSSYFIKLQTLIVTFILGHFPNLYKQHYLSEILQREENKISLKFFFFFLLLIMLSRKKDQDKIYYYFLTVYDCGLFLWILFSNTRISDYLVILSVWLLYMYLDSIKSFWKKTIIYCPLILCNLILVLRIVRVDFMGGW